MKLFDVKLYSPAGCQRVTVHAPSSFAAIDQAQRGRDDVRAASARLARRIDTALAAVSLNDTEAMRGTAPASRLQGERVDTHELGSLLLSSGAMTGPHRKTRPSLPLRRRIALAFRRLLRGY